MENKNESLDFSFDESNININYKEQTKYLFSFIKRYIGNYIKGIVATICSAFFSAITPIFVKKGIEALEKGTTKDFIVLIGLAIASFGIIRSALLYIGRTLIVRSGRLVEKDIRDDIFKSTLSIRSEFFDKEGTGKISSVIINDIENIRMMLGIRRCDNLSHNACVHNEHHRGVLNKPKTHFNISHPTFEYNFRCNFLPKENFYNIRKSPR
jgi:ABC-type multidrug transport system, ATPase and permease components